MEELPPALECKFVFLFFWFLFFSGHKVLGKKKKKRISFLTRPPYLCAAMLVLSKLNTLQPLQRWVCCLTPLSVPSIQQNNWNPGMLCKCQVHESVSDYVNALLTIYFEKSSKGNHISFLLNMSCERRESENANVCLSSLGEQQVWILMKWNLRSTVCTELESDRKI